MKLRLFPPLVGNKFEFRSTVFAFTKTGSRLLVDGLYEVVRLRSTITDIFLLILIRIKYTTAHGAVDEDWRLEKAGARPVLDRLCPEATPRDHPRNPRARNSYDNEVVAKAC